MEYQNEDTFLIGGVYMYLKRFGVIAVLGIAAVFGLTGCQKETADQPVSVSIWHVYGGQADSPLNDMIDIFNQTVGKEQGIRVETTLVSNTNNIHKDVLAATNQDPGAAELPDMFISYPKTVLAMPDSDILVDYNEYFSEQEKSAFIQEFMEEGVIDGKQLILPLAKSTEVMFINKTAFDRFTAATGVELSDLQTWEGLYQAAETYEKWSGGKSFFAHDYHFNYFQVGTESLGEDFFQGDQLSFGPMTEKVWEPYAKAAISGGVWLQEGYATEPLRTGDAIVSVASSASVLYYSDTVTYPDNTSEQVEIIAMPCPVFADGESLVMQRGAGVCLVRSTPEKEKAAITFLKWITEAERNTEFVTKAGYMPVTKEGVTTYLEPAIGGLTDPMYQSLYRAFLDTYDSYRFYTAPQLDTYLDLEMRFEETIRLQLRGAREKYASADPDTLESLVHDSYLEFKDSFQK